MSDAHILQMLGLVYFALGLGVLINSKLYKRVLDEFMDNLPVIYTNGFIIFAIGFLLVTFHNTWVWNWSIIVTIIGWIALIKGLLILILPGLYIMIAEVMKDKLSHLRIKAVLILIIGAVLTYIGYFVI